MEKIVVADDHSSVRVLVEMILQREGRQVLHAADGEQALEVTEKEKPDLLILDLMMPGKFDGFSTLQQLKEKPLYKELPVLVLSACHQPQYRERAQSLGAKDYLQKPFPIDSLLQAVDRLLPTG
ncbi:Response regulator receiver domain-containing protein [Malonomonas rubra DSM 5091]|uniref:Response regulator receiver domain-containing protein n=1 Tax=Malonomonas rubra DSM 5091 TaxID=1122189 RepID=A0A1M6N036_MALRU|nr:response regulator [Malonomonas rubra]SHJ88973.1 Response regulator receiver domain-containing protein [Malonomonas rubra DSM 5091]